MIDVAHHMLPCWSTCSTEIHLYTRLRLVTSPGCHSEKLNSFHICIFQLILLTKMQFFFRFMWLLHCSWFFFSCKSFLLGVNNIFCIHGSFLLSPTLPEVWNFHARPEDCVRYMFSFSLFRWFHKLLWVLCLHIVRRMGWKPLQLKMLSDPLARSQKHWYQVWLHHQLQLNVEDIHPLIVVAAVPHAHLYKRLLTVST